MNRVIAFLVSILLIWSGIDKWMHYDAFIKTLLDYVVLPETWAQMIATPVIAIELFLGISLLWKKWRPQALFFSGLLLCFFAVVLLTNRLLGGRGLCGCWFTFTLAQSTTWHIAQNLLLGSVAFLAWHDERSNGPRILLAGQTAETHLPASPSKSRAAHQVTQHLPPTP